LAPDLVAEVLDENDRPADVLWKIADWLEAGTRIVWVIDPLRDTARIHRADGSIEDLGLGDTLYGDHVLRGYAVPLRELLS
jgi:Uma2 family endonuclease